MTTQIKLSLSDVAVERLREYAEKLDMPAAAVVSDLILTHLRIPKELLPPAPKPPKEKPPRVFAPPRKSQRQLNDEAAIADMKRQNEEYEAKRHQEDMENRARVAALLAAAPKPDHSKPAYWVGPGGYVFQITWFTDGNVFVDRVRLEHEPEPVHGLYYSGTRRIKLSGMTGKEFVDAHLHEMERFDFDNSGTHAAMVEAEDGSQPWPAGSYNPETRDFTVQQCTDVPSNV